MYKYNTAWEDEYQRIIEEYSPDIVHIWGCEFAHSVAMVRAIQNKMPFVVSIHGIPEIIAEHYFDGLPLDVIYGFTVRDLLKRDNIWFQKRKYLIRNKFTKEILHSTKFVIGRTDYDCAYTRFNSGEVRYFFCNETLRESFYKSRKWSVDQCDKHTLFCSQVHYPIKGFHYLLKAVYLIKNKFKDIKVYVAGQNILNSRAFKRQKYWAYLLKLINKYNLNDNIIFLGNLTEHEMCEQYLKANVFVSSSLTENESNSISEAKILGVPIIASFVGGVTERVTHYRSGLFYQHNEPMMLAYYIEKLFSDNSFASAISNNEIYEAQMMLKQEDNYEKHITIYKTILSSTYLERGRI